MSMIRIGEMNGLIVFASGIVVTMFLVGLSTKSFGGITGDVMGASNELTRLSSLLIFLLNEAPIATERPCPKDPEAIRTPGKPSWVVGCPCNLELINLKVFNSSTSKYPHHARTL